MWKELEVCSDVESDIRRRIKRYLETKVGNLVVVVALRVSRREGEECSGG